MAVLVTCYDPHRVRDRQASEAWKDKYEVKAPVFAAGVFVLRTNDPPQQVFDALQACLKAHANLFVGVLGAQPVQRARVLAEQILSYAGEP